jgi:hypothetical protein
MNPRRRPRRRSAAWTDAGSAPSALRRAPGVCTRPQTVGADLDNGDDARPLCAIPGFAPPAPTVWALMHVPAAQRAADASETLPPTRPFPNSGESRPRGGRKTPEFPPAPAPQLPPGMGVRARAAGRKPHPSGHHRASRRIASRAIGVTSMLSTPSPPPPAPAPAPPPPAAPRTSSVAATERAKASSA